MRCIYIYIYNLRAQKSIIAPPLNCCNARPPNGSQKGTSGSSNRGYFGTLGFMTPNVPKLVPLELPKQTTLDVQSIQKTLTGIGRCFMLLVLRDPWDPPSSQPTGATPRLPTRRPQRHAPTFQPHRPEAAPPVLSKSNIFSR